ETQQKQDYHHLQEVINQGMPMVMFDRVIEDIACDKVIIDDVKGARKAVQKLIDLHCKKIALITTVDYVSVGKLRTRGYRKCLQENNIPVDEDLILKIEDFDNSEAEIKDFLATRKVDGLFAVNEHFAVHS